MANKNQKPSKPVSNKADNSELPAYQRENFFPAGTTEIKDNFEWVKFDRAGTQLSGVLSRKFTDKNNKMRYVLYDESRETSFGLPDHIGLTGKLDRIPMGSSIIIVCSHVGTGRGDAYQYRVAVTEYAPLPEPPADN